MTEKETERCKRSLTKIEGLLKEAKDLCDKLPLNMLMCMRGYHKPSLDYCIAYGVSEAHEFADNFWTLMSFVEEYDKKIKRRKARERKKQSKETS